MADSTNSRDGSHNGAAILGAAGAAVARTVELALLGGFRLTHAQRQVVTPHSAERLIAFLALRAPADRSLVAGVLWPDVAEPRAQASLRTSLWHAHRRCPDLLIACGSQLCLGETVHVDAREHDQRARRILHQPHAVGLAELTHPLTTRELLPGWYEDWILQERERSRQLRLHTLEAAGEELLTRHKPGLALDAALAALAIEPLRESAHRLAIRVHLAEGNPAEALRHYATLMHRLREEFGVAPSDQLHQLIADIRTLRYPVPPIPNGDPPNATAVSPGA